MLCLSILQPYAHLIVTGAKRVENRRWYTGHRGRLLLHAGKSDARLGEWLEYYPGTSIPPMPRGAIVGGCRLVGVFKVDERPIAAATPGYEWLADHEHVEGPWCWVLEAVHRLAEPIPYRGQQRLFDVPVDMLEGAKFVPAKEV